MSNIMSNCKIDNFSTEYIVNTLKNKDNLYNAFDLSTNDNVKKAVEKVSEKFKKESKEDNVYTYYVKDTLQRISRTFTSNPNKKSAPNEKTKSSTFGDVVHEYMKEYVIRKSKKLSITDLDEKYFRGVEGFQFTSSHLRVMKETGDAILNEAKITQDKINKDLETNDSFVILAEVPIIDGPRDIGGTPDLVIIFSNKTAIVYDYKTTGNIESYSKNLHKYLGQLRDIKHTFNSLLDVEVVNTKLINFNISFLNKDSYKIKKFGLRALEKENSKTKFANGEYATLGIKGVDDWIKKQYEYLFKLETAIRKQKDKVKKDELRDKKFKLQETIQDFIYKYEYDVLNDYLQNTVIPEINAHIKIENGENLYDKMENEEAIELVSRQLEEIALHINLLQAHKNILPNSKGLDIENTITSLKEGFELLSAERQKIFLDRTDIDLQEGDDLVFKANKISQFQRWMKRFSSFAHPLLKSVFNIHVDLDNEAKIKMNSFSNRMYDLATKLASELKKDGLNFQKVFINSTGNYISEISSNGWEIIREAIKNNDIEKAKNEIYDLKKEEFIEWYNKASKRQRVKIENELIGLKDENEAAYNSAVENRFTEWDKKYNVIKYPEVFFSDFGKKFLKFKPEFKKSNMSNEFRQITGNPVYEEYWNFIHETNDKVRDMLGMDYKDIPNNFFPNVKKEIAEGLTLDLAGAKSTYRQIVESFSINETDVIGNTENKIPIMFISKLSVEDKSFDYAKSMTLFYNMAVNYERAKTLESYVQTAQNLLSLTEIEEKDSKGNSLLNWMRYKQVNKNDSSAVEEYKKVLEAFIQREVYGQKYDSTLSPKITKFLHSLNKFARVSTLGLKFPTALGSGWAANIARRLEAKKGIIVKEGDFIDFWTERKSFTASEKWNVFRDAFSPVDDKKQQSLLFMGKGLARKALSDRTMLWAYRAGDELQQDLLGWGMAKNYGIDSLGNVKLLSKLPKDSKSLFELLKYENNENGLSIWLDGYSQEDSLKKIMSFRSKVRNAYFNIAGTIDESDAMQWQQNIVLKSLFMFKSWMPGAVSERLGKIVYNKELGTIQIPRYTAAYEFFKSEDGKNVLNKLGNITKRGSQLALDSLTFSKIPWIFGEKELDGVKSKRVNLEMAKARYVQFLSQNKDEDISFDEFVRVQEGQLKAIAAELRVIALFVASLMLLGSDDDDMIYSKENNMLSRFVYKSTNKALSEILYWYNPTELLNLAKNPIPSISVITTALSSASNGVDELRDGVFGENSPSDHTPVGYYSTKLIRGMAGIRSIYSWYDYENTNN